MRSRTAGVFLVGALTGCAAGDGPHLEGVEPAEGARGTMIAIHGERLCGARAVGAGGACDPLPAGAVSFGIDAPARATIVAWRDDRIDAVVPAAAADGELPIVVTVDGRSSNAVWFRVR